MMLILWYCYEILDALPIKPVKANKLAKVSKRVSILDDLKINSLNIFMQSLIGWYSYFWKWFIQNSNIEISCLYVFYTPKKEKYLNNINKEDTMSNIKHCLIFDNYIIDILKVKGNSIIFLTEVPLCSCLLDVRNQIKFNNVLFT